MLKLGPRNTVRAVLIALLSSDLFHRKRLLLAHIGTGSCLSEYPGGYYGLDGETRNNLFR